MSPTHRRHNGKWIVQASAFALASGATTASASFLSGEAMDTAADVLAWVVLVIVPVVGISLFWIVHVLPEKIAHRRHHPQAQAIHTLCLLSLVFGGLLWPIAWLWAYTRPVGYKLAYGTERSDAYFTEQAERARAGRARTRRAGRSQGRARRDAVPRRTERAPGETARGDRGDLVACSPARARTRAPESLMEVLILAIYGAIVWFIFIKMKWLPWNTATQVTVVIIPIVGLTALVLLLNVVAPSSADVRVVKYVINVVPQVRGRVIEVPVEPNRLVRKGDVLFRIDPTPYELTVRGLEAQLANTVASGRELDEQLVGAGGKVTETRGAIEQAESRIREVQSKLVLANMSVKQNRELVATGAGDRFTLERAETDVAELEAQVDMARSVAAQARSGEVQALAGERQIRQRIGGKFENEYAPVAQIRAQLANAKWELSQTTVYAPADGYAINVQLRPGSFTTAFPITPAMTFVEETYQVIALYGQNELYNVEPGNSAEFTLNAHPGRVIKASVDSIVWAQGQGQIPNSTQLPMTGYGPMPPGRFPVKLAVAPRDADLFLPAGAVGHGAIYTEHGEAIQILRKVILRIGAKIDYLVLKLH